MARWLLTWCILWLVAAPVAAGAVLDWSDRTYEHVVARDLHPSLAERTMTMSALAVFEAVNAIAPRYRSWGARLPATGREDPEAAAAAAAAGVLAALDPASAAATVEARDAYLGKLPAGPAREAGAALGAAAAAAVLAARASDGSAAPEQWHPNTPPGVYVPTATVVASQMPGVAPFALGRGDQFRPGPPPALDSARWRADLAEIAALGGRDSAVRTPAQTEAARFWLTIGPAIYYQVVRQLVVARRLESVDAARFLALIGMARMDAIIAVFDAKYRYAFWRPVTAVRAAAAPGSPGRAWTPIGPTPMHPEYPCAHCIQASAIAGVALALPGALPEITATSPTAPGVTRRWPTLDAMTREVDEARIWAGFHYRFSSETGNAMGRQIGAWIAGKALQPLP